MENILEHLQDERVLAGLTAVTVALSVKLLSKRKPRHPPGPTVWPIVGTLPSMKTDIMMFNDLADKYGDIYYLQLGLFGYQPTVVLNSIDLVREALLQKQDDFAGRYRTPSFEMFSDNGADIVFGDFNETWRFQRKLAHAAIRKYATGSHFQGVMEHAVGMVSEIFRESNGKTMNIHNAISLLYYNIIASMCFGKRYDLDDLDFNRIRGMIDELNETFSGIILADIWPVLRHIPTPYQGFMKKSVNIILDYIQSIINEHKATFSNDNVSDLTDLLIQTNNEMREKSVAGNQVVFTDLHFRQTISDMFLAGTDTSRLTTIWALLFLAAHPHVQKKAQKEIDDQLGRDAIITTSNRVKIPYVEAIIYETLRLRNPAPLAVPHETTCDTSVGGYDLPKGTQVFINILRLGLDPHQWDNPMNFQPERFIDEDGNLAPKPNSFLPFSTGRRQCVGEAFAKSEIHVLLGMLLQRFDFLPPEGKSVNLDFQPNSFTFLPVCSELVIKER